MLYIKLLIGRPDLDALHASSFFDVIVEWNINNNIGATFVGHVILPPTKISLPCHESWKSLLFTLSTYVSWRHGIIEVSMYFNGLYKLYIYIHNVYIYI